MSALNQIRQWQSAAKTRRVIVIAWITVPLLIAFFLLSSRFVSQAFAMAVTLAIGKGICTQVAFDRASDLKGQGDGRKSVYAASGD